jgi:hypothetical protein
MSEQLGDKPAEARWTDAMNLAMSIADDIFNPSFQKSMQFGEKRKVGIVMLVFPFEGHEGRCNFISNGANRDDLVVLFKEMIARFSGQPEIKGNA